MGKVYNKAYGDMSYNDYINSWLWKDKANYFLEVHGHVCDDCGRSLKKYPKLKLQVHHTTYKSIGNEGMHDLKVLCSDCHKKEHGITKRGH